MTVCRECGTESVFDMFAEIGERPLGTASIGQTHFAKLKDGVFE